MHKYTQNLRLGDLGLGVEDAQNRRVLKMCKSLVRAPTNTCTKWVHAVEKTAIYTTRLEMRSSEDGDMRCEVSV